MKKSSRKWIIQALILIMLMLIRMSTTVSALSYELTNESVINSYDITSDVVTLYIGNVSVDGTSTLKYLYTDKSVNTATLTEIGKILTGDYATMLPTTAGQVKVSNDNTVTVNDIFTDAGLVAANKYTGTVEDISSTILYSTTDYNNLTYASAQEVSAEVTAETNNLSGWNTRKTEWETAEQAKADEDPGYTQVAFPEEYIKAFNDNTTYPTDGYFHADVKGDSTTSYIIRNGVVAQVDTYPINRTIIKVVNTSANVTTAPVQTYTARLSAINATDGEKLEGAEIQLKKNGNVVKTFVSTMDIVTINDLESGEYTLHVNTAPEGYTVPADMTFSINDSGEIISTGNTTTDGSGNKVLLIKFNKTNVKILTVKDADYSALSGVVAQILDNNQNVVEEWTSSSSSHIVEGLKTNIEYTLKVTVVPDSDLYDIPNDATFTISDTGVITSTGDMLEQSLVISVAEKEITTHTVTFKDGNAILFTRNVENGESVIRPTTDPTKEGFNFVDWYLDSTLTTKYNFSTPITADTFIYAKWNRIPFPFTDNFESYEVGTTIASGGTAYTKIYNGTGDGNQVILSKEQKDGTTGNVLQLQGASGWSSQIKYSFTPDDKQYLIVEADVKPLSLNSPAGISLCSSSAGGSWTHSVCGINMTNGGFSYGRNDNGYPIDTDLTYTTGNWYHLTLVLDRTNQRFYTLLNDTFIEETSYDADSATPEWLELNSNNHGTNTAYFDNIKLYSSDTFNITFSQTHLVTITGGTSSPELSAEENAVVTITADEAPSGTEFYKWKVVSGGITLADDTSATTTFTMGAKDVEVIAMYKYIIQGQITYELRDSYGDGWHGNNYINIVDVSNDATVESLTMSGSALNGTTQNLEPGHIYELRWQIGSYPGECSFTLKDEDGNILITRNGDVNVSNAGVFLTVGIKEPTPKHTVSFETYGGGTIDSQTLEEGQKATRPTTDPTRVEYNFTNWYADEAMTTLFDFTKPIAEDTVIYAGYTKDVWVDNTVDESKAIIISEVKVKETLTGEEKAKETFNEEVATTYTSNASSTEIAGKINLARTAAEDYITTNGYTNKGVTNTTSVEREWDNRKYETDDGVYSSTENALIKTHTASGGYGKETTYKMSYSAEYTKKQFTVSFMDGTNEISSQTVIDGQKVARPTPNPTKANHEFINWYADSTLTTVFNFNTLIDCNMCIYAKFNPVYHDITISLTDGANINEILSSNSEGEAILEFFEYKGILIYEEDSIEKNGYVYNKDHKLLFKMDKDKNITFAEGITYKDNIEYTPTEDDKAMLDRAGIYGSKYILSFGEPPFEYKIVEGANQTHTVNKDGSLNVKANGDISKFVKLLVDKKEVAKKDCTITSGSTIATLSKDFLDTLSEGTHELTFVYTDGEVSTNFTIAKTKTPVETPVQSGGNVEAAVAGTPVQLLSKSPITGDNIILWIILLVISVNGFIATEVYIRKVFKK